MRERINTSALCSSSNYKASRRAHRQMLNDSHNLNLSKCEEIQRTVTIDQDKLDLINFESGVRRIFSKSKTVKEEVKSPWKN